MAISDNQKIDYLFKKLGFGVSKTDTNSIKNATNEDIASPLLLRGDNLWTDADLIPNIIPSSNSNVIKVYSDAVGTEATVETTEDTTATPNRTWKTGISNWIPPQFGSTYQLKVYIDSAGASAPQSTGTQIFASGSGNNDEWFFDYQSGVLHFIGDNLPSGVAGNIIYVSGAAYIGKTGNNFTTLNVDSANIARATILDAQFPAGLTVKDLTVTDSAYLKFADIDSAFIDRLVADSATITNITIDSADINILNITVGGRIQGQENLIIDPRAIGDNTGRVIIKGDLMVEGLETIVNSTTVTMNDKNLVLADSAPDLAFTDGAGIIIAPGVSGAAIRYDQNKDRWVLNRSLEGNNYGSPGAGIYFDSGNFYKLTTNQIEIGDVITARDIRITSPNVIQGGILTIGDDDSISTIQDIKVQQYKSTLHPDLKGNGFLAMRELIEDSGYYKLTVDQDSDMVKIVGGFKAGIYTNLPVGQYAQSYPYQKDSNKLDFYGIEYNADSNLIRLNAQNTIIRTSFSADSMRGKDSAFAFQILTANDSTLFSVARDGTINFGGALEQNGADFIGGGAFTTVTEANDSGQPGDIYFVRDEEKYGGAANSINGYGFVGIQTRNPRYELEVAGTFQVADSIDLVNYALNRALFPYASQAATGKKHDDDTKGRMTFIPQAAMFRAGEFGDAEYNVNVMGQFSTALGKKTIAGAVGNNQAGEGQFAAGWLSTAAGNYSVAIGRENTTVSDRGVENVDNLFLGSLNIANYAPGPGSYDRMTSIGHSNYIKAADGIILGTENNLQGYRSIIIGAENVLGDSTISGQSTNPFGGGAGSVVVGNDNIVTNRSSFIFGRQNNLHDPQYGRAGISNYVFGELNTVGNNADQVSIFGNQNIVNADEGKAFGSQITIDSDMSQSIGFNLSSQPVSVKAPRIMSIQGGNVIIGEDSDKFDNHDGNLYVKGDIVLAGQLLTEGLPGVLSTGTPFVDDGLFVTNTVGRPVGINTSAPRHALTVSVSNYPAPQGIMVEGSIQPFDPRDTLGDSDIFDSTNTSWNSRNSLFSFIPQLGTLIAGDFPTGKAGFEKYLSNGALGVRAISLGQNNRANALNSVAIGNNNIIYRGPDSENASSILSKNTYFIGHSNEADSAMRSPAGDNYVLGNTNRFMGNTNNSYVIGQNARLEDVSGIVAITAGFERLNNGGTVLGKSALQINIDSNPMDNTKVGIGKDSAQYALDVRGSLKIDSGGQIFVGSKTIKEFLGFGEPTLSSGSDPIIGSETIPDAPAGRVSNIVAITFDQTEQSPKIAGTRTNVARITTFFPYADSARSILLTDNIAANILAKFDGVDITQDSSVAIRLKGFDLVEDVVGNHITLSDDSLSDLGRVGNQVLLFVEPIDQFNFMVRMDSHKGPGLQAGTGDSNFNDVAGVGGGFQDGDSGVLSKVFYIPAAAPRIIDPSLTTAGNLFVKGENAIGPTIDLSADSRGLTFAAGNLKFTTPIVVPVGERYPSEGGDIKLGGRTTKKQQTFLFDSTGLQLTSGIIADSATFTNGLQLVNDHFLINGLSFDSYAVRTDGKIIGAVTEFLDTDYVQARVFTSSFFRHHPDALYYYPESAPFNRPVLLGMSPDNSIFTGLLGRLDRSNYTINMMAREDNGAIDVKTSASFGGSTADANGNKIGTFSPSPIVGLGLPLPDHVDVNNNIVPTTGSLPSPINVDGKPFPTPAFLRQDGYIDKKYINDNIALTTAQLQEVVDDAFMKAIIDSAYILSAANDSSEWQRRENTLFFGTFPSVSHVKVGIGTADPQRKFHVNGDLLIEDSALFEGPLTVQGRKITVDEIYRYQFDGTGAGSTLIKTDSDDLLKIGRNAGGDFFSVADAKNQAIEDQSDGIAVTTSLDDGVKTVSRFARLYRIDQFGDSHDLTFRLGGTGAAIGSTTNFGSYDAYYTDDGGVNNILFIKASSLDSSDYNVIINDYDLQGGILNFTHNNTDINGGKSLDYNTTYSEVRVLESDGTTVRKDFTVLSGVTLDSARGFSFPTFDSLHLNDIIEIYDRSSKISSSLTVVGDTILGEVHPSGATGSRLTYIKDALLVDDSTTLNNNLTISPNGIVHLDDATLNITGTQTSTISTNLHIASPASTFIIDPSVDFTFPNAARNLRSNVDDHITRVVDSNYIGSRLQTVWNFFDDSIGNQYIYYKRGATNGQVVIGEQDAPVLGDSDTKFFVQKGNAVFNNEQTWDGLFGTETEDVVPDFGTSSRHGNTFSGARMMWIPQRGAFRAGAIDGAAVQWSDEEVGRASVGIGYNTLSTDFSVALGYNAQAGNMGPGSPRRSRRTNNAVSIGHTIDGQSENGVAIGRSIGHSYQRSNNVSIGKDIVNTYSDGTVAIGDDITSNRGVAIGKDITTSTLGSFNTAIGYKSTAQRNATAIGYDVTANYGGVAIGKTASASAQGTNIAIGKNVGGSRGGVYIGEYASGSYGGVAIGKSVRAHGGNAVAIGNSQTAGDRLVQNVAVGYNNNVSGGVVVGLSNVTSARQNHVILGISNKGYASTYGTGASPNIIIGSTNTANGKGGATIIGVSNTTAGPNSFIFGSTNRNVGNGAGYGRSIVLGYNNQNLDPRYGNIIAIGEGNSNNTPPQLYYSGEGTYIGRYNTSNDASHIFGNSNTGNKRAYIYGSSNINANSSIAGNRYNGSYAYMYGRANTVNNGGYTYGASNEALNNGYAFGVGTKGSYGGLSFGMMDSATNGGISFGHSNWVDGLGQSEPTLAFGYNNTATLSGIAYGENNTVSNGGMALGGNNTATAFRALALGSGINVTGQNSVGIGLSNVNSGTVSTSNTLSIMGGQVGVGVTSVPPAYKMEIGGTGLNVSVTGDYYRRGVRLYDYIQNDVTPRSYVRFHADSNYIHSAVDTPYLRTALPPQFFFASNLNTNNVEFTGSGSVGIGRANSNASKYKLDVLGNINYTGALYLNGDKIIPSTDSIGDVYINHYQQYYQIGPDSAEEYFDSAYVTQRQQMFGMSVGQTVQQVIDQTYISGTIDRSLFLDSAEALQLINENTGLLVGETIAFKHDPSNSNTVSLVPDLTKMPLGVKVAIGKTASVLGPTLDILGNQVIDGDLDVTGELTVNGEAIVSKTLFNQAAGGTVYVENENIMISKGAQPSTLIPSHVLEVVGDISADQLKIQGNDILDIFDSAYVIERQKLIDSELTGNMIDSAYIRFRADSNYILGVADSAYITHILGSGVPGSIVPGVDVNGDPVYDLGSPTNRWRDLYLSGTSINIGGAVFSTLEDNTVSITDSDGNPSKIRGIDSDAAIAFIDSDYVQARANSTYLKTIIDSSYVQQLVDSSYVTAITNETYIRSHADSAWITSIADSAHIRGIADSAWITSIADSAYVLNIADSQYISSIADSAYISSVTGIGSRAVDFGGFPIIFSNAYATEGSMPNAGSRPGNFTLNSTTNKPFVSFNGAYNRIALKTDLDSDISVLRSKVDSDINAIIGGAPEALDTLKELSEAINNDSNFYATITALASSGVDSEATIALIDSAYVLARSPQFDYITLIDSAYVQARQLPGTDSEAVIAIINSNPTLDSAATISLIDSAYINARVSTVDSAQVLSIVDSSYILSIAGSGLGGSGSGGGSSLVDFNYIATANQSLFTGSDADGSLLSYDPSTATIVSANGITLTRGVDYTHVDSSSISFTVARDLGDEITIFTTKKASDAGSSGSSGTTSTIISTSSTTIFDRTIHSNNFKSIEYTVHIEDSSLGHTQITKLLATYNKSQVFSTQYGTVSTFAGDSDLGVIDVVETGGQIQLTLTKASGTGTVKVVSNKTVVN